jgi:hypothetical protein
MFNFNKQLTVGKEGEDFFLKCYKFKSARKADGYKFDLWVADNLKVELKTDSYPMEKTENFFMEQYGNIEEKETSVGGPWRAKKDSIDYFVYLFLKDRTFFWFKPNNLCKLLDKISVDKKQRLIKNSSWTTAGILIRRDEIKHLCVSIDTFTKNGKLIIKV